MKRLLSYIAVLFLTLSGLQAQAPRLYSTADGLASTRISQIMFDKDNFLWVTTDRGLCRFEGKTFTTYQRQSGNPYALQENQVSSMYEDENGRHWLCGTDGLYYVCRTENSLSRYVMDSTKMWISLSNVAPHPLRANTLLVGTYGMGVYVFDTERCRVNREATDSIQLMMRKRNCQQILTDRHARLWIAYSTDIQCIDLRQPHPIRLDELRQIDNTPVVHAMLEDPRRNCLYLATLNSGLLCCDLSTMHFEKLDYPELNQLNLTALNLSPDGDLIIGTESQGLWQLHNRQLTRMEVADCPVDLNNIKIHSITFDDQKNLWLGLYQKGLLMIPRQKKLFTHHSIRRSFGQHNLGNISSFASMSDGSRLYGIDGAGLLCQSRNGQTLHLNSQNSPLLTDAVLSVVAMNNNMAYVGTYNFGIYLFDGKTLKRDSHLSLLDKQSIMTMAFDSLSHTLYIGTNGDGIYSYQTQTHELQRLTSEHHLLWIVSLGLDKQRRVWASTEGAVVCLNLNNGTRIVPRYRLSIRAYNFTEDTNGTIWFATNHGLLYYVPGSDSLRLAKADNVPMDDAYTSILQSKDGNLWLPSSDGLFCYDPRHKSISHYIDPEIMAIGSFSIRAATIWPDSTLTFGGDNGTLEFKSEAVLSYRPPLRPIQFNRLWVNNVPTDYDPTLSAKENVLDHSLWKATKLHLPASSNNISLSFSLRDYCNPLGVRYSYHLEGYDKTWHDVVGQDNTVSYSSMPWGKYVLHVRATTISGNGNVQNTEKTLAIEIDAPWYASWWAQLIYVILIFAAAATAFHFIRIRAHQRRVMRRTEHNRQIKEAKLRMFTQVSHEIKTPLTLIISPLRRLMQRNNDNATQSVYEMMYRNSLRILMLITQQMDIRKIDNGQMRLHVKEVSLRSFLDDIMQFFSDNALSRKIDFRLLMPDDENEIKLYCDPEQLDKVIFNLLANAFKYVKETGQVLIKVYTDEAQHTIRIDIFNSGSRLKSSNSENIFERFGSEGSESLSLNLANDLTELHHGRLTAQSDETGVTFSVTLPMGHAHFTEKELELVNRAEPTEQEQLELEARAIREDGSSESRDGKELIEMLSEELQEKQRLRERRARLNFNTDMKPLTSADEKLLNRVSECISKNLADADFNVEDLAQQVGISRIHLNRKLKELIDTTPSALIKNTRLKQGAYLLIQSNVPIAEVAYTVGFNSPAYFSANFTAYFKMTPREFVNAYTEDADNPELKKLLE